MNAKNEIIMQNNFAKKLGIWALVVAGILMIPLLTRAPWTISDFIFAGTVLFGSACVYEFVTKSITNSQHRLLVGGGVLFVLFLIWGWAVA